MHKIMALIPLVALVGCGQGKPPPIDSKAAYYEAQKLLVVIDGKPKFAAFLDQVLKNDDSYNEYFVKGVKSALAAAPTNEPAFAPYKSCVEAGNNLAKFAELRRMGGKQNEESDKYRSPFWESLELCKKAVNTGEQKG